MKRIFLILPLLIFTLSFCGSTQEGNEKLVVLKTNYGEITMMLYNDTPIHRDNFIKNIKEGWYTGSPFHRVIKNFMIQGGGNADGRQDPGYTLDAEITPDHFHKKGALAAARMPDNVNPEKKSSGCQFYIVQGQVFNDAMLNQFAEQTGVTYTEEQRSAYKTVGGAPHLDGGYTVFGEVISGFAVIDKIGAVATSKGDRPIDPVTMTLEILE